MILRRNYIGYVNVHQIEKTKELDGGKETLVQIPNNTEVKILEHKGKYSLIDTGEISGWVFNKFIVGGQDEQRNRTTSKD